MKTLIRGGILALPDGPARMDLLVDGETIADIGIRVCADGANIIDATGCTVLPGGVDPHTHMDLPVSGTITADDFASGTRAAIKGGTTTIIDYATQDRGCTLRAAFDTWRGRMAGKLFCDVALHMAITDWNHATSDEIGEMAGFGITSYKLYMAYPALQLDDDGLYFALRRIREVGGIAGVHCENGHLITALSQQLIQSGHTKPSAHPLSRPPEVEAEAIHRLLTIAQLADTPVYIVHLSSKLGLMAIRQARVTGQPVFIETCPQYLMLDDTLYERPDGSKFVCSPPLRKTDDASALFEALAAGEIDVVATDHCSFRYQDQKRIYDDFTSIPNGLPGVEHRLALMMTIGVDAGRFSLSRLVKVCSENPARIYGLYPKKGVLQVGSDADLVLWDPALAHQITAEKQIQNVDYTPYEGFYVSGGIRACFLRGCLVTENHDEREQTLGKYLHKNSPFAEQFEKN